MNTEHDTVLSRIKLGKLSFNPENMMAETHEYYLNILRGLAETARNLQSADKCKDYL